MPSHWVLHGHGRYGRPQYTNVQFPFPIDPPNVPDENPVGDHRRTFDRPGWDVARVLLRFDGVESVYRVVLNGTEVGVGKGSRLVQEFDVTGLLVAGRNELVVRVHQWSSMSYVEDQDQWWLPGIFRDVTLLGRPRAGLDDVWLRAGYTGGRGTVDPEITGTFPVTLTIPELGVQRRFATARRPGGRRRRTRAALDGRDPAPLRRDGHLARGDGVAAAGLPHRRDRGRAVHRQRSPGDLPRDEPARDPPRARAGVRRGPRPRRPAGDEAAQRQRHPHQPLPAAPPRARAGRRAGVLGGAGERRGDPRVRRRRLAGQPERRPGVGGGLPRPDRTHRRARQEPRVRGALVAGQRGGDGSQPRGDGAVGAPPRPRTAGALRGRRDRRLHRRVLADVPLPGRGRGDLRGLGRHPRPLGGADAAGAEPAVPDVRVRARHGQRPRRARHLRRAGRREPAPPRRVRLGVARPRDPHAHRRRHALLRLRRRLRRGRPRRQLRHGRHGAARRHPDARAGGVRGGERAGRPGRRRDGPAGHQPPPLVVDAGTCGSSRRSRTTAGCGPRPRSRCPRWTRAARRRSTCRNGSPRRTPRRG